MSEISKLAAKVKNAERRKSPELRITFEEAKQLLSEIEKLQERPLEVVQFKEKPPEVKKIIKLDGGSF